MNKVTNNQNNYIRPTNRDSFGLIKNRYYFKDFEWVPQNIVAYGITLFQ